ncbi:unnamed protein product [Closterium sp. NIES-54]
MSVPLNHSPVYISLHANPSARCRGAQVLSRTFQLLTSAFHHVFFIPGNHELWCRHHDHHTHHSHHTQHQQHSEHTQPSNHDHQRHSQHSNTGGKGGELPAGIPPSSVPASPEPFTSLHKLTKVLQCCERWGVRTEPMRVGDVWIVPLWSWHHQVTEHV